MVKLNKEKKKVAFWAGLSFFLIGGWMIFIATDNLGWIGAVIGAYLLYISGK